MDAATQLKDKQKKILIEHNELAAEIKTLSPKVAYYCRLYAVEQALALGCKDLHPAIDEFVKSELQDLEKAKPSLGITSETYKADADNCRGFAKWLFTRADKADRSGIQKHIPAAVVCFKRASQFFIVATQFGALPEDCARLQKYAAWRSVALNKAYKEGRTPEAPSAAEPTGLGASDDAELMAALASLPGTYIN